MRPIEPLALDTFGPGCLKTSKTMSMDVIVAKEDSDNNGTNPIKVGQPYDRLGMDIVGPLPKTRQGNQYIVIATEYLTKWPEAQAIPDAKASSVVSFFYEEIIMLSWVSSGNLDRTGNTLC